MGKLHTKTATRKSFTGWGQCFFFRVIYFVLPVRKNPQPVISLKSRKSCKNIDYINLFSSYAKISFTFQNIAMNRYSLKQTHQYNKDVVVTSDKLCFYQYKKSRNPLQQPICRRESGLLGYP